MPAGSTLLLNSTYEPLQVISWQRAVVMIHLGKAEVLRSYKRILRAVSFSIAQPAVIRLVGFVKRHRTRVAFSRRNVFLRDGFRCQYCNQRFPSSELTCDHVTPRSVGGRTSWENLVTACGPCNRKKGDRTPEQARMRLVTTPTRPDSLPPMLFRLGGEQPPEPWRDFLLLHLQQVA
jgi:5-methylcytosine-specific restriction endonuclease McrA